MYALCHSIDPLGATYIDETNGYSIRFPAGWALRTFSGEPWVLDCGDVKGGIISIGFSPMPAEITADQLLPEAIARLHVDPLLGFQDFHGRRLAFEARVDDDVVRPVGAMLTKLGSSAFGGLSCPRGRRTWVPETTTVEARPL